MAKQHHVHAHGRHEHGLDASISNKRLLKLGKNSAAALPRYLLRLGGGL